MEIRAFAEQILETDFLAEKLAPIRGRLSDDEPGPSRRVTQPARPVRLCFAEGGRAAKMPRFSLRDPHARAIAHHIMANHELQALEVMAWTLLAFPDAPAPLRRGLVGIMAEEQRHTQWHLERLSALGMSFGEIPVNGYVWRRSTESQSLLEYLARLHLTFEGSNLDHSREFESRFRAAADLASAAVMHAIHRDEIRHVAFGWFWLKQLKKTDENLWQSYSQQMEWPLTPFHAKGKDFDRRARRAAGMTDDFIDHLAALTAADTERWRRQPNTAQPHTLSTFDCQATPGVTDGTGYTSDIDNPQNKD